MAGQGAATTRARNPPSDAASRDDARDRTARARQLRAAGIHGHVNLLAPAVGTELVARGRVVRAGRTLNVCQAEVVAVDGANERPVALLVATIMTVHDRPAVVD